MNIDIQAVDNLCMIATGGGADGTTAELDFKAQYGQDIDALTQILAQSQNEQTLVTVCQGIVSWWKNNIKTMENGVNDFNNCFGNTLEAAKNCLFNPDTKRYIRESVILALAKVTKLTYQDEQGCNLLLGDAMDILGNIENMNNGVLDPNSGEVAYALNSLVSLVQTFNKYEGTKAQTYMNFAVHRRCSNNFRDTHLLDIFVLMSRYLGRLSNNDSPFAYEIVQLIKEILTYDFMAIMVDETEEALSTQYPANWKETLFNMDLMEMLWNQVKFLQGELASMMMAAMGGLCGCRRSFFDNNDEKFNFLNFNLDQLASVATASNQDDRMNDPEFRHLFADAILKFVPPFGYKDLSTSSSFKQWIDTVAAFTQMLFNVPFGEEGSYNTTQTLLNFWARMTNSKRMYLSDEERREDLEGYVPTIAVEYIKCRTTPQNFSFDEEVNEQILQQCEQYPALLLLNTRDTLNMITQNIQEVGDEILSSPGSLAWLFYLTGCSVRVLMSNVNEENANAIADFIGTVTNIAVRREENGSCEDVEIAALHYFSAIHSVFVTSRMSVHATKIVEHVFTNKSNLFQVVIANVGANMLRDALESPKLVRESIDLIGEACRDAPSSLLRELNFDLPPVIELSLSRSPQTYKMRTALHATLWAIRLPDPFTLENFNEFMAPIEYLMNQTMSGAETDSLYIAGWLRDLRGVAQASSNSQQAFADFIDWIIDRADIFTNIAQMPGVSPMIVIALLRFISELVTAGRHGRVNLPTSNHSAAGVILFKFVAGIVQNVLENVITDDAIAAVESGQLADGAYTILMKPLMICMQTLRKCVSGDFVPFGAMVLYDDNTFDVTVVGILRFLKIFPPYLFAQYQKVIFAAMHMIQSLIECQVYSPLMELAPDELRAIIDLTLVIVSSIDTQTSTLLYGLTFITFIANLRPLVLKIQNGEQVAQAQHMSAGRTTRRIKEQVAQKLLDAEDLWPELIMTAMNIITTQDRALSPCCSVVWPIFDSDANMWTQFSDAFCGTYPPHKRDAVMRVLGNLADAAQTEQKFFSEIFHFRASIRML